MAESTFEKRCLDIAAPIELSYTSASVVILLIFTNILGNVLIILAVAFDPNNNLRTPFNWLVINLAAADLIVGIIAQPMVVFSLIKEGLRKHGNPEEWVTSDITFFISCTASVLSLSSLAVERYLAVRNPNAYRTKVTNKRIVLTIVTIWLISVSLPNMFFIVESTTYALISTNMSLVFAVLTISVTYTLMRRQVNTTRYRNGRYLNASSIPIATTVIRSTESIDAKSQISQSTSAAEIINTQQFSNISNNIDYSNTNAVTRRQLLEAKVTKIFLIVLIALLCCYGPSTIMMYLVNFCEDCSCRTLHWFRDIYFLFIYMNSSINFFCYAFRSPRFRSAFAILLKINRNRNRSSSFNSRNVPNTSA